MRTTPNAWLGARMEGSLQATHGTRPFGRGMWHVAAWYGAPCWLATLPFPLLPWLQYHKHPSPLQLLACFSAEKPSLGSKVLATYVHGRICECVCWAKGVPTVQVSFPHPLIPTDSWGRFLGTLSQVAPHSCTNQQGRPAPNVGAVGPKAPAVDTTICCVQTVKIPCAAS